MSNFDFYTTTVDCLKNNRKKNELDKNNIVSEKDKKFYRKRIINITNELIINKIENNNDCINDSFNEYIYNLINHFKLIDRNELIQNNLDINCDDISLYNSSQTNILDIENYNEKNNNEIENGTKNYLFNAISKKNTLDKFVIKTDNEEEEVIYPKKLKLKLKSSNFKNKGIFKKKNTDIIYDEEDKKNKNEDTKNEKDKEIEKDKEKI